MIEMLALVGLAFGLSALLCFGMVRASLVDMPDGGRKVHAAPTPTSGGLAFGAAFGASLAAAAFAPSASSWAWPGGQDGLDHLQWALLAACAALAIGARDDVRPINARLKMVLSMGVGVAFCLFVVHARYFPIGPGQVLDAGPVIAILGSALWVFTLQNSVNFMDGANGLAMGSVGIGLGALGAIAASNGLWHLALVAWLAAAALGGFLLWNFPMGRVFAGDAGALFAGALAAYLSLILVEQGNISPIVPPLLFFPLLADVLLTLLWRLRNGRNLLQPHRDHLYQIAMKSGWSHARVTCVYWIMCLHCAAVAWVVSFGVRASGPERGLLALLAWISALGPWLALIVLAWLSARISARVRRYAAAKGLG
jgi:UDP-GlcNAc:undecaprenyl-phosphate/decaprenyl-phosphate GlcNAc-1-phosphate transferase